MAAKFAVGALARLGDRYGDLPRDCPNLRAVRIVVIAGIHRQAQHSGQEHVYYTIAGKSPQGYGETHLRSDYLRRAVDPQRAPRGRSKVSRRPHAARALAT